MERYRDRREYYSTLTDADVLGKVRSLMEQAGYYLRDEDNKVYVQLRMAWDYPWHHVRHIKEVDCHLWHRVMFDVVGLLPTPCLMCFKVVVRPQNLRQLFALLDLQVELNRPSKCGIEDRPYVFGNYGGYFYNRGIDAGWECYDAVKEAVSRDPELKGLLDVRDGNGVPKLVILKRGCTEFERQFGRSDKWRTTDDQVELERRISDVFVREYPSILQPPHVITHVHRKWVEFAWDRGDPTAVEFNGGRPLHQPPMTYHGCREGVIAIEVKKAAKNGGE